MSTAELQKAVVSRLKTYGGLPSLVGQRVYDGVPTTATFPYLSYGNEQILSDRADCYYGKNVSFQIDVWSRAPSQPEVKNIASAVIDALVEANLSISGYRLVGMELTNSNVGPDPDGLTKHAALTFLALIEPV